MEKVIGKALDFIMGIPPRHLPVQERRDVKVEADGIEIKEQMLKDWQTEWIAPAELIT